MTYKMTAFSKGLYFQIVCLTRIVLLQVTFGRTENFTILTMVVHYTESLLAMMAEEFPKLSYIRSIFSINVGVLLLQLLLVF